MQSAILNLEPRAWTVTVIEMHSRSLTPARMDLKISMSTRRQRYFLGWNGTRSPPEYWSRQMTLLAGQVTSTKSLAAYKAEYIRRQTMTQPTEEDPTFILKVHIELVAEQD